MVDSREVENILIKILKLKDSRVATKKSLISGGGGIGNNSEFDMSSNVNGSMFGGGIGEIGDGFDQEAELFLKKIKSEI